MVPGAERLLVRRLVGGVGLFHLAPLRAGNGPVSDMGVRWQFLFHFRMEQRRAQPSQAGKVLQQLYLDFCSWFPSFASSLKPVRHHVSISNRSHSTCVALRDDHLSSETLECVLLEMNGSFWFLKQSAEYRVNRFERQSWNGGGQGSAAYWSNHSRDAGILLPGS